MSHPSLPERILCLVTDLERAGGAETLLEYVDAGIGGGVNMVQVRAHELDEDALAQLVTSVAKTAGERALVVVNGPVTAALAAGAGGIHLRENASGAERLSAHAGKHMVTGMSAHSVEAAERAESQGTDYIILGTVFPSGSHPGGPTGGTELVAQVSKAVRIPVIGIGGITAENAGSVMAAGARGIAVISAIIGQADPQGAASRLARAIGI